MRLLSVLPALALATCTVITRCIHASGTPIDELERLLSALPEASTESVAADGASRSAPQALNLDGSWADILRQSAWVDHPSVGRPVNDVQNANLATFPSTELLEHTTEQRRQLLETVKDHFYFVSERGPSRIAMPRVDHLIEPFRLTMDRPLFETTMHRVTRFGQHIGMHPLLFGSNRYMLQQASQRAQDFQQLYGFAFAHPKDTWYHVYQVKSRTGNQGVFELLGAIRGPHRSRNSVYRELYLGEPKVALANVEAIGSATFTARIGPYPP